MADSKKTPIILKITKPDGSLSDAVVEAEQVIVGSGPSAGVKIEDPKVSSLHFMLKVDKNGVVNALDLGSEHGTVLGGKKIIEPTAIASGDTLHVGDHRIRVAYGDAERTDIVTSAAPAPARPPSKPVEAVRPPSKPAQAAASPAAQARPATKPPPAAAAADNKADNKPKAKAHAQPRAIGTIGATAMLFNEELPAEETPSDDSKVLEVAQLWGDTIINIGTFAGGEVTVGSEKGNHFHVFSDKAGPAMLLVRAEGSSLLVTVPDGADVVFRSSRSQKTREQLQAEGLLSRNDGAVKGQVLKLALHDRALVSIDNVAFVVRWVRPQKALPLGNTLDYYFTKVLSVTFMAFLAAWWAVKFTDLGASALSDDLFKNAAKYQKIVVAPPPKEIKKILDLSGVKEGAKAQKEEGKFGKIEAKKQDADPSKKGAPKVDPNKREEDRMKVAKAGMLGALSKLGDDAVSNVMGPGGMGTGMNNALGGLKGGAGMGDAHGVGGLGSRGTGPGGGGTGLGLGGLGTKGNGHGKGGYGSLDLGGKGKDTVRVVPGKTTVVGALSREEIERVIKRHENEILFCYKTELNKDPNLYGKVAVNFTIDGSGAIGDAQIAQTTMNNNNVEQCMLSRIRRWRFPEPKGGGQVVVTYPWILRSAEGGGGDE